MRPKRGPLPDNFREETLRQAVESQRMRDRLDGVEEWIGRHARWLYQSTDAWDALGASCGTARLGALAERAGLDPRASAARDVFLTALSTISTYKMAWDLALRFSTGAAHKTLLAIWHVERGVNALARRIFCDAEYLYRGQSADETVKLHDGTVGPALRRSFVSLSSSPKVAIEFAFAGRIEHAVTAVALAIDAHKAREAGAVAAIYSLAADALGLRRSEEGVGRTFPLENADELQIHFPSKWPPGSDAMMVAIIAISHIPDKERLRMESIGLPILDYADIFSQN